MSGDIYISGKSSNNKITISGSGEKKDIDLSTKEANNNLATQNNNAKYYSDKALESANKAEQQANLAKGYAESIVETKNELLNNEDFKTVVNNIDNINTVGENIENVITIAEDLDVVADSLDVINNVNDNLEVITNVNTNIQDINTVASNIEDIQNAEENANIAKEKAQESADYSELSKHYSEISKAQADIATSKTNEVVESGNTALTEIEALGHEKINVITVQTEIAITKASEASQSASNALKSAENSALSEANAKTSENKAKASETSALNSANVATQQAQIAKDEVAKLSTVYKYKGSVATISNLPTNANVGDVYDTQETGMNYAWNGTEWDELGGTFDVSWGSLKGSISDNTDLQTALDSKANVSDIPDVSNFITKDNLVELPSDLITEAELEEALKGVGGGLPIGTILTVTTSNNYVPENTLKTDGTEFSGAEGQMFHELYAKKLLGEITQDAVVETTFKATNGIFQGSSSFLMFVRVPLTASSVPYGDLLLNFTTGADVTTEQFIYKFISGSKEITLSIINGSFVTRDNTPAVAIATANPNTTYTLKLTSDLQVSLIENGVETVIGTASSFSTTYCWFFGNAGSGSISGFLGTINLLASTYTNELGVSIPLAKMQSELDTCTYAEYETELTMTGSCWKWAVDTANEKFRIPFIPDKVLVDVADTIGVRGNGMALGLMDDGGNYGGLYAWTPNNNATLRADKEVYGKPLGTSAANSSSGMEAAATGLADQVEYSGIEGVTTDAKTYKTIRHYVVVATGSVEQTNADWTNFASGLASKANNDLSNVTQASGLRRLIEVSDSSLMPSWYKVFEEKNPATGEVKKWCEQGGTMVNAATTLVVSFLKIFSTTDYTLNVYKRGNSGDTGGYADAHCEVNGKDSYDYGQAVDGFRCSTNSESAKFTWETKGYIN